jgi:hypothetical protein
MKPGLIMAGMDGVGDAALHLHAENVGQKHFPPAALASFTNSQDGGQDRNRGMGQQPVNRLFGGRKLCVVVVHGMAGDPVGERGFSRRRFETDSEDRRFLLASEPTQMALDDARAGLGRAGQHYAQSVQHEAPREPKNLRRNVFELRPVDEVDNVSRQTHCALLGLQRMSDNTIERNFPTPEVDEKPPAAAFSTHCCKRVSGGPARPAFAPSRSPVHSRAGRLLTRFSHYVKFLRIYLDTLSRVVEGQAR